MKRTQNNQSGNALWFILVAIVLLGALTVLLSRSGTSVNQSGDVEQARIRAGQIMRYAKGLESAIDQMKLRGISENAISFENEETVADYTNPNCDLDTNGDPLIDCKIFANGGGGQVYQKPPTGVNDGSEWLFSGYHNFGTIDYPVGTTAAATGNDLAMILRNVNTEICIQINKDLNIGTSGTIPQEPDDLETDPFVGIFNNSLVLIDGSNALHELNGKSVGCYVDAGSGNNVFYYVLLAR